ncbi:DoxX family membrane protein [Streptomyces aureus]|uniref:DoxX family membrane protein n=1 Tax=Streptomyces aureus TaxID=193461 RepID=UPI000560A375|nr:DoxX family membrane protein [Streptomyces aureus]
MTCATRRDMGLLLLRLGVGSPLIAHGTQKLFGWFGGPGIESSSKFMEDHGYQPGKLSAVAAGVAEAGGGALLGLGLATPAGGAAVAAGMVGAAAVLLPQGFFGYAGGYELNTVYGVAAAAVALTGPGTLSLDHVTGYRLARPWMVPAAFAVAGALTAVAVGARQARLRETRNSPAEEG